MTWIHVSYAVNLEWQCGRPLNIGIVVVGGCIKTLFALYSSISFYVIFTPSMYFSCSHICDNICLHCLSINLRFVVTLSYYQNTRLRYKLVK